MASSYQLEFKMREKKFETGKRIHVKSSMEYSHSHKTMGTERDFYEGRQRTKQTERQPRIVVDFIKLNT